MATFEVENTVDLCDVDDGISKEYDLHLLHLGCLVVSDKLLLKVVFQVVKV